MDYKITNVKIYVTIPVGYTEKIREAIDNDNFDEFRNKYSELLAKRI